MIAFLANVSRAKTIGDVNIAAGEALPRLRTTLVAILVVTLVLLIAAVTFLGVGYVELNKRFDDSQRGREAGFTQASKDRHEILAEIEQLQRQVKALEAEDAQGR